MDTYCILTNKATSLGLGRPLDLWDPPIYAEGGLSGVNSYGGDQLGRWLWRRVLGVQ